MTFTPDWTSPLSDTLLDIMEERGISETDFVQRIGCTPVQLDSRTLSAETAEKLSHFLGSTPKFWINRGPHTTPNNNGDTKMTEYKTRTISHNLQELIDLIDSERFAEVLNKRIQGVQYEADMVRYDHFSDEEPHGWDVYRLHTHLHATQPDGFAGYEARTISDRNTAAFVLGKAILDTLEEIFIEPRFREGYGD